MISRLNLKTNVLIAEELERRKAEYEYKKRVAERTRGGEIELYEAFKKQHPELFKK